MISNELIFWILVTIWAIILASTVGYQFYNEKKGKIKKKEIIAEYILASYILVFFVLFFTYYYSLYRNLLVIKELMYIGVIISVISLFISIWAIKQWGKYFSYDITVFEEQGVINTGPYKYIRHPLYSSTFFFFIGLSLVLGSILSLTAPLILLLILFKLAVKEEKILEENVDGYKEYLQKVKYRFVPYLF